MILDLAPGDEEKVGTIWIDDLHRVIPTAAPPVEVNVATVFENPVSPPESGTNAATAPPMGCQPSDA